MSGCRSCSSCSPNPRPQPTGKAEKLEKGERSNNPRYPHVFVGKQAIYTDEGVQMIVTVVEDQCDESCDCFTLDPQRILKDLREEHSVGKSFNISKPADDNCWKLRALI